MNKGILLLCISLFIACSSESENTSSAKDDSPMEEAPLKESSGFSISLNIEDRDKLTVDLHLDSGIYVVSPYSPDDVYGHFQLELEESEYLIPNGDIVEVPVSVEEIDSILKVPVRFVKENTTYIQAFEILSSGDFEVNGSIWFVHEPQCQPYEMTFTISHLSGKLHLINLKRIKHPKS